MNTKQHGFTLIEMMITITILGILLAIAVPSFTDWLNRKRIDGVANEFASLIQLARSESTKQNKKIYIQATRSATDWSLMATTTSATCTALDACDLRSMRLAQYSRIAISDWVAASKIGISPNLNGAHISPIDSLFSFNPASTTDAQSVTFETTGYQLRVLISRTGNTTICTPTGQKTIAGYSTCPA